MTISLFYKSFQLHNFLTKKKFYKQCNTCIEILTKEIGPFKHCKSQIMVKSINLVFNLLYRPGRNKTTSQPVDVLGAERLRVECRRLSSVAVVGDRRDVERRGLQLRLCQRRQRLDLRQSRRDRENQLFLNSSERQFGWRISDQRRTFRRFKL